MQSVVQRSGGTTHSVKHSNLQVPVLLQLKDRSNK